MAAFIKHPVCTRHSSEFLKLCPQNNPEVSSVARIICLRKLRYIEGN